MEWLDKFISSFAAENEPYQYRDQKDVYRDTQQGTTGINQEKASPTSQKGGGEFEDKHREDGVDLETGEEFKVEVHKYSLKPRDMKDKQEKDWVSQEAIITITSLDDDTRSIRSSLNDLCNGRYASYISLSSEEIAKKLMESQREIFGHIEASMASYSSAINAEDGVRLARAASTENSISSRDYAVIKNKIEHGQVDDFEEKISKAGIKISQAEANVDYYLAYIRDFKEYKTGNEEALFNRVSSMLSEMKPEVKARLINKLRQDEILSKFIKQ